MGDVGGNKLLAGCLIQKEQDGVYFLACPKCDTSFLAKGFVVKRRLDKDPGYTAACPGCTDREQRAADEAYRKAVQDGPSVRRGYATAPAAPQVVRGVAYIRAGRSPGSVAKELDVAPQTAEWWYFRWVVFPDYLQQQEDLKARDAAIRDLQARLAQYES